MRISFFLAMCFLSLSTQLGAQSTEVYDPPRTEFGYPDFQGSWVARSLTPLERPDALPGLVVSAAEADRYIDGFKQIVFAGVVDPDILLENISHLNRIGGELRSSAIIDPADGRIPFTELGLDLAGQAGRRDLTLFDHPEQRPLDERCLGSIGLPPFRPFIFGIPRKIVQTSDYVLIYTEDPSVPRIIRLTEDRLPNIPASFSGYSTGVWEGDALVIETDNFRDDELARLVVGRSVLIGSQTRVLERLTPTSEEEILYEFSVEDPRFYSQLWRGEFTFELEADVIYEYSCHEGNYSMPAILRGGQMEQARLAAASDVDN